ncbi:MAG: Phosphomannomutase [Candidatus Electronema aureum]|uniref:Phosphomannomutase n=1 Tax=Candidatus Electronema aureum TaxID=2005002 RepID=A0A521G1W9_9BACT|nr:MAG: Phosphomannomutase [Candidatus Electronema aureum]
MDNIKNLKSTSDGWRGVTADTFTYNEVGLIASAIAKYIQEKGYAKKIIISYDTRFLGEKFAQKAAQVFKVNGIIPLVISYPIPTPLLSFRVNQLGYPCGISITASHNPYNHNGIKLRMNYGGAPTPQIIKEVESFLPFSSPEIRTAGAINFDNPLKDYVEYMRSLVDMESIHSSQAKILIDPMYGTTAGLLKKILGTTSVVVDEIHTHHDPYFGGVNPEPQRKTTLELQQSVSIGLYDLGIAHDGDGDRLTACLPDIGYLSPHDISAVLLWYLVRKRKLTGKVIGSLTLSRRLSRLAEYFGLEYVEIPIGFHYATALMLQGGVLIAAEENGGIGFGFYLPERDATLAALMLIEAEVKVAGGIASILEEIGKISGKSGFYRMNIDLNSNRTECLKELRSNIPKELTGIKVCKINDADGLKIFLTNGDWVCIRVAGTEDLLRIYAEAGDNALAEQLANEAAWLVKKIDGKLAR